MTFVYAALFVFGVGVRVGVGAGVGGVGVGWWCSCGCAVATAFAPTIAAPAASPVWMTPRLVIAIARPPRLVAHRRVVGHLWHHPALQRRRLRARDREPPQRVDILAP